MGIAYKFAPFDEVSPGLTSKEIREEMKPGLERINIIKQTVEPKVDVMIDCHWRFNPKTAIELVNQCKNLNLYWIECPIIENNIRTAKQLQSLNMFIGC